MVKINTSFFISEMEQVVEKYVNLWNVFIRVLDNIPLKTRKKKEYDIPAKSLGTYFPDEKMPKEHDAVCTFIKQRSEQYILILTEELRNFDMKFKMLLDRFEKSSYYQKNIISLTSRTVVAKDDTVRAGGNVGSLIASSYQTHPLPFELHYQLQSEDYQYTTVDNVGFTESDIYFFMLELFKYINNGNGEGINCKSLFTHYKDSLFRTQDLEELEFVIRLDDKIGAEDEIVVINEDYVKQQINDCFPYLENANTSDIATMLEMPQFRMFYQTNEFLNRLLGFTDLRERLELSRIAKKVVNISETSNTPIQTVFVNQIEILNIWRSLNPEVRLLLKTFFNFTQGNVFLKPRDLELGVCPETISGVAELLHTNFVVINEKNPIQRITSKGHSPATVVLYKKDIPGLGVRYYPVVSGGNVFIHINFKMPSLVKDYVTFAEFSREKKYVRSSLEEQYDQYRDEFMRHYYVPKTFETAILGYLHSGVTLYGVREEDDTFVVFDRYRIPKEPLKTEYHRVYNLVKVGPPTPVVNATFFEMLKQGIVISMQDLWKLWINAAEKNAFSNLIERTDGYQTSEGFYCRESDIWKSSVYQQHYLKDWDLERVPFLSLQQIKRGYLTVKNVCLISCITSHWDWSSRETLQNSVLGENTVTPLDIDYSLDESTRPRHTVMKGLTQIQLLPFILKLGPVVRRLSGQLDVGFYINSLMLFIEWNSGKHTLETLKPAFSELFGNPEIPYEYLIRDSDMSYLHTESILPLYNHQFPPLPCYVLCRGNQKAVLFSFDETADEFTVMLNNKVLSLSRDEFQFYHESRILPYPVSFLKKAYDDVYCGGAEIDSDMVSGRAVEHFGNDQYRVVLNDEQKRNLIWNEHFIWDDQLFVSEQLPEKSQGDKVYMKDISIDDNGDVYDNYVVLEQPYQTPKIIDRTNNPPFFSLYHASSQFSVLPFLNFVGVGKFWKNDQEQVMKVILTKKVCMEPSCLLVQASIVIWNQCMRDARKWDKSQLWDSLGEFLDTDTKDGRDVIDLSKLEDHYSVLKFILEKLYNVQWHHSFKDLWVIFEPDNVPTKMLKLEMRLEELPILKLTLEDSVQIDADLIFQEYPEAISLYECFFSPKLKNDEEIVNEILDQFWYSQRWYDSVLNISEAMKFRDRVWNCLVQIPKIMEELPKVLKQKMFIEFKVSSTRQLYRLRDPRLLVKVVKYLNNISMFEKVCS